MLLLTSSGFISTQLNSKIIPPIYIMSILYVLIGLVVYKLIKVRPDKKKIFLVADATVIILAMVLIIIEMPAIVLWMSGKLLLANAFFIGSILINFVLIMKSAAEN